MKYTPQPRTLEVFRFLGVLDEVLALALPIKPRCDYKLPGGTEVLRIGRFGLAHLNNPEDVTPARPHVRPFPAIYIVAYLSSIAQVHGVLLGQYNTEAILRKHIERLGGTVEYGTELRGLKQHSDFVEAELVTKVGDGTEKVETVTSHWLVGSDGGRSMRPLVFCMPLERLQSAQGAVRKQLGLSFLGETREEGQLVLGLVEVKGLGTEV